MNGSAPPSPGCDAAAAGLGRCGSKRRRSATPPGGSLLSTVASNASAWNARERHCVLVLALCPRRPLAAKPHPARCGDGRAPWHRSSREQDMRASARGIPCRYRSDEAFARYGPRVLACGQRKAPVNWPGQHLLRRRLDLLGVRCQQSRPSIALLCLFGARSGRLGRKLVFASELVPCRLVADHDEVEGAFASNAAGCDPCPWRRRS